MSRRHFGSIRKLPSGRYQATYWHKAERHTAAQTFLSEGDAQAWLSSIETDIKRGAWVDPTGGQMTVAQLANRWSAADPGKRYNTRTRDEITIRLHIASALGTRKITDAPDCSST